MPISPQNPRILERQFVTYLRNIIPDFDDLSPDRQREIAWAFYGGVTALNKAMNAIALNTGSEPSPHAAALVTGIAEEVESINERMWAGDLVPRATAYPGMPTNPSAGQRMTADAKAALLDEIEALCRSEAGAQTHNVGSDYGTTEADKVRGKAYAEGAIRVAHGVLARIERGRV